jgi:hypothetical protein
MHVMLAEDIGGWLVAGGVLFGGLALAVLALLGLFPAVKGHRGATMTLAGPAFIMGVAVAVWLIRRYFGHAPTDPSYNPMPDFIFELIIMAGPSLAASLLAVTVLLYWRRRSA